LVLAGIHADNAAKAVAQLQLMNDEQFLFANALKAVVSQRLVRRLCPACSIYYTPDREELRGVEKAFGLTSPTAKQKVHHLEQQAIREGIGDSTPATTSLGISNLWRASDDGCAACSHTGYQGAIAVVEVLSAQDNELETALLAPVSADKVRKVALKAGFIPMELDGLIKALRGQTTLTELLRVVSI
jgi:type IV pilus assembly protein PilB